MKAEDRRSRIVEALMETGAATVDTLADRFDVSRMTIHRDLDELEDAGLLRKVRGGASIRSSLQFESDFRYRTKLATAEKRRISAWAATKIEPGQTVMIDDGSTVGGIGDALMEARPLTVITNNAALIEQLAGETGIDLISLGGFYSKKFHGFFGIVAEEALSRLRADVAILTSTAVQGAQAFHQDPEVVALKRLMIAGAEKSYLLVDHTKFGRNALHFFTDLTAFDTVITSAELSVRTTRTLSDAGVTLEVAQNLEEAAQEDALEQG